MINPPLRTLSGRLRLAFMALILIGFAVLTGSIRSDAKPGPRSVSQPHAAATSTIIHIFDPETEGQTPQSGLI